MAATSVPLFGAADEVYGAERGDRGHTRRQFARPPPLPIRTHRESKWGARVPLQVQSSWHGPLTMKQGYHRPSTLTVDG